MKNSMVNKRNICPLTNLRANVIIRSTQNDNYGLLLAGRRLAVPEKQKQKERMYKLSEVSNVLELTNCPINIVTA